MMSERSDAATPLTDLCAICHLNPIKYTCPRDGIHTCSLPCVKRHKQWAQCSGVRDPAEYRKRSELATSSSIDKDFNFITGVERSISRADDTVLDRGIDLAPARLRPHETRPKFEIEAASRGIRIIKAPKGLSRSKQNRTYWGGQEPKCIIWSVEWICHNDRRLFSSAAETKSVRELFDQAAGSNRSNNRNSRNNRKRKRASDASQIGSQGTSTTQQEDSNERTEPSQTPSTLTQQTQTTQAETTHSIVPNAIEEPSNPTPNEGPDLQANTTDLHFYLHRPNTESRYKCLIPVFATDSLQTILQNKTLIEFPTFYVRSESPDRLEAPFIVEDEYIKRHGVDIPINVSIPVEPVNEEDVEEGEVTADNLQPSITETKVLEVLAKDLVG